MVDFFFSLSHQVHAFHKFFSTFILWMRKKFVSPYHHPSWLSPAEAFSTFFPCVGWKSNACSHSHFSPSYMPSNNILLQFKHVDSRNHLFHQTAAPQMIFLFEIIWSHEGEQEWVSERGLLSLVSFLLLVNKCLWGASSSGSNHHHAILTDGKFPLSTQERKNIQIFIIFSLLLWFHADVEAKPKNHKHTWNIQGATLPQHDE